MASNPPDDGGTDDPPFGASDSGTPDPAAVLGVPPLVSLTIPVEKDAADGLAIEVAGAWSGNGDPVTVVDDAAAPCIEVGAHEMVGEESGDVDMLDADGREDAVDVRAEDTEFELVEEKMIVPGGIAATEIGEEGDANAGGGGDRNGPVHEQERQERRKRGRPRRSTTVEDGLHFGYSHRFQDEKKEGFTVGELVWGKVRSHPWWPGQIFDAADASEMALNAEQEGRYLVVYFGDKTFAWCDESHLKRFQGHFARLEKQGSTDVFFTAVNDALEEVSSLIDLGMACSCSINDAHVVLEHRKVKNAGVREGTCSAVDKSWIMNSFEPEELVNYVRMLALSPCGGADSLDLVIAKAHLKSFSRANGHPALTALAGLESGNDGESSPATESNHGNVMLDIPNPLYSDSMSCKMKFYENSGTSRKKIHVLEDGRKRKSLSELMAGKNPHNLDSGRSDLKSSSYLCSLGKRQKIAGSCPSVYGKTKMKKLDSLGDLPTPSLNFNQHLMDQKKSGQFAGMQTRYLTMIKMSSPGLNQSRSAASDDLNLQLMTEKIKECLLKDSSPNEMLSQLRLVASDPLEAQFSLGTTVAFFIEFNHWVVTSSSEIKIVTEIVGGKRRRGRLSKVKTASCDLATPDYIQDSYWSDIIVSSNFEELESKGPKRNGESRAMRQKKMDTSEEQPEHFLPSDPIPKVLQIVSACAGIADELGATSAVGLREK